ncbi:MAG: hypothetical protein ACK5RK_14955 [Betaproteobacteria bacterium]
MIGIVVVALVRLVAVLNSPQDHPSDQKSTRVLNNNDDQGQYPAIKKMPIARQRPSTVDEAEVRAFTQLRGEFENSSNLVAFIHSAIARRDRPGRIYAQIAVERCFSAEALTSNAASMRSSLDNKQIEALNFYSSEIDKCRDINTVFQDRQSLIMAITNQSGAATLPHVYARRSGDRGESTVNPGRAEMLRELQWLLDTRDGNVLAYSMPSFTSLYFVNMQELPPRMVRALGVSFEFAACGSSSSCRARYLAVACVASSVDCGVTQIESTLGLDDPDVTEAALAVLPSLLAAISAGDADAFVGVSKQFDKSMLDKLSR